MEQVSFANSFAVAVHEDGLVRAWGIFPAGFLGWWPGIEAKPRLVPGLTDVKSIAAGGTHVAAIRSDGTAWIWGDPDSEVNPTPTIPQPTKIDGIENAEFARVAYGRTFIRETDGRVFGLGEDGHDVFGDDTDVPRGVPIEIDSLRGVLDIALGSGHGIALTQDGHVLSWGSNVFGQLGDGPTASRSQPAEVPLLDNVVAISARIFTSMALRADGTVWIWGGEAEILHPAGDRTHPARIEGLDRVVAIACGGECGFALRDDGVMLGWGSNGNGELGDGTTTGRHEPTPCLVRDVRRMFVGEASVHVITSSGERYGWGWNVTRAVGDGTYINRPAPVPVYSR